MPIFNIIFNDIKRRSGALLCEVLTLSDCEQVYSGGLKKTGVCKMSAENVTLTSYTEQRIVKKTLCACRNDPNGHTHVCLHGLIEAKLLNGISVSMHKLLSDVCDNIGDSKRRARSKIITGNAMKSVWEKLIENCRRIQK